MLLVSAHSSHPHLHTSSATTEHSDRALSSPGMAASSPFSLQGSPAPPQPAPKPPLFSMSSSNPRPSRKPKLSLQTASVPRTFGKSTTSLTLNISSDPSLSPTVRNTFCNAYDSQRRDDAGPIVSSSSLSSTSTTSSSSSFSLSSLSRCGGVEVAEVPYKLPRSARSILRNSPLGHARRSGHLRESSSLKNAYASSTSTTTTTVATRKPLFAPKKQVRYRTPLQEEIKTVDYVARHSDLYTEAESDSSDISAFSSPEVGSDDDSQSDSNAENHPSFKKKSEMVKERAPKPMLPNIARQLRTALSCNTSQPGSPITTTSQSISTMPFHPHPRKKKSQKWRWTLGPVMDGRVLPGPNPEETEDRNHVDEPTTPITPTWTAIASDKSMSDRPDARISDSDDDVPSIRVPALKRRQTAFEYGGDDDKNVQ